MKKNVKEVMSNEAYSEYFKVIGDKLDVRIQELSLLVCKWIDEANHKGYEELAIKLLALKYIGQLTEKALDEVDQRENIEWLRSLNALTDVNNNNVNPKDEEQDDSCTPKMGM